MQRSPRHRHLFLDDLKWALPLKQFRRFHKNPLPLGCASWAFMLEEVEARLKSGRSRLKLKDWQSGEACWPTDLVAPAGAQKDLPQTLKAELLAGHTVGYLGRDPETGKMKAIEAG